ncbi:Lrp/AsnC family transcriptional regulator [Nocardioides alcanivorans]|uniref:Lrp/AsnC family transcriptional regulator n=1 Tax=Nocardioides alcanivorans TaxID=2897352 RepID=UPI001F338970|nr:Lrp/AsnC family transcriptional regulator [Nocardioides alcanivorans]
MNTHDVSAERSSVKLDDVDRALLDLLRVNARMPISELARAVNLSSAPVSRRIDRLERSGVIRGYVAVIDERAAGELHAFTEIRLNGDVETGELEGVLREMDEVQSIFTIAGDPDVLVRWRVSDVDHLQRVVNGIRRTGKTSGTKTLIVMYDWTRGEQLALPTHVD